MDESLIKLSKVPDRVPTVNDISGFKFAWNTRDGKMFGLKDNGDGTFSVVPVGSGGLAEAESDPVFQAWLSTFVAAVEKSYLSLTDTPDSYAGKAKNIPIVTDAENGLDFMGTVLAKLTHLADFPASMIGHELKLLRINAAGTMVEPIVNNFITAITKAMVEDVLIGDISSHTHTVTPTYPNISIPTLNLKVSGHKLYAFYQGDTSFLDYNPKINIFRYTKNAKWSHNISETEIETRYKALRWRKVNYSEIYDFDAGLMIERPFEWDMIPYGEWSHIAIDLGHWVTTTALSPHTVHIKRRSRKTLFLDTDMPEGTSISANYGLAIVLTNPDPSGSPHKFFGPISKFRIGATVALSEDDPPIPLISRWIKFVKRS